MRRKVNCAKAALAAIAASVQNRVALPPAPIAAEQLIEARRIEDTGHSLWITFQRVQ